MKVSVFGLGYVGVTTAACLANEGHTVTGVDVVDRKVQAIEAGTSPIVEERVETLVADGRAENRLRATTDGRRALEDAEIVFVCVGTPSQEDGSLDISSTRRVAAEIGDILGDTPDREQSLLIVFRSTMLPGTTRDELIPVLEEHSGRAVGDGYEVAYHPEFMREGSAVHDFYNPPKVVVGERYQGAADRLWTLYRDYDAPGFSTSLEAAEAVKYADNAFHALKITFANEMGQILKAYGVDSREVMEIFRQDTKLNISPAYLRPGFAFGGSCLPKDLRALTHAAREKGVDHPMLDDVLASNERHVERVVERIEDRDPNRVGMVGLSFKPGTDDLRESPFVELAERLVDKQIEVRVFDRDMRVETLGEANTSYVKGRLSDLSDLLVDSLDELAGTDLVVVGHPVDDARIDDWIDRGVYVLDLVGVSERTSGELYEGVAW